MIQLAINYSHPAAKLLRENRLPVDRFKCPDWPDLVTEAQALKPVAVHFTLSAGSGGLEETDWSLVERLRQQTGTPYVNLHLNPMHEDFPGFPVDTTDPEAIRMVTERMIQDVGAVVKHFGPENVIAENVPYLPPGRRHKDPYDDTVLPGVLPQVIRQVLDETGCGLLLDIPHARISAHYLGMDEHEYITSLPVERIREMHTTGLHVNQYGYLQDHLGMLDSDWPSLDWVLDHIRGGEWGHPWMMAFEYGGVGKKFAWRRDPQVMARDVELLAERLEKT